MPRRTREQSLAIREAILDAAERVIARYGIGKTTMNRVAHASGASRGAIYWHFQDKHALYEAVAERIMAPPGTASRTGTDRDTVNPVGDLRNLLYAILRRIARDPSAWYLIEARSSNRWTSRIKRLLMQAKQAGLVAHALDTDALTLGLWIIILARPPLPVRSRRGGCLLLLLVDRSILWLCVRPYRQTHQCHPGEYESPPDRRNLPRLP